MASNAVRVSLTPEGVRWLIEHCQSVIVLNSQMSLAHTLPVRAVRELKHETETARAALSSLEEGLNE